MSERSDKDIREERDLLKNLDRREIREEERAINQSVGSSSN